MDYTKLEIFKYLDPNTADSLPEAAEKLNENIGRLMSWLPNGILSGGLVQHISGTNVSHGQCFFHFDGEHYTVDSTASLDIGTTSGEFYLYFDSTSLELLKESTLSGAQSKGVPAARCFVSGSTITDIYDIREVISTMPQDIAELKNRTTNEYNETISSSSIQWNINHNLDSVNLSSITCYDDSSNPRVIIPNYIEITDKDNILIDWGGYSRKGSVKVER